MPRANHGPASKRRTKRVLKRAKGFVGGRGKLFRTAHETVMRAMYFAFRDRKAKKREMRSLFILRVNAGCRANGISYSKFISGLKKANVSLDRKVLSEIVLRDDSAFAKLVEIAKSAA